jgi:hypothetical protein
VPEQSIDAEFGFTSTKPLLNQLPTPIPSMPLQTQARMCERGLKALFAALLLRSASSPSLAYWQPPGSRGFLSVHSFQRP